MSFTKDEVGGEVDDDQVFLDQVLNKLYDFGDDKRAKKSRKRKKNSVKEDITDHDDVTQENTDIINHDTELNQHMRIPNSVSENTEQSSVQIVTFIDPLKKKKVAKTESEEKVPGVKEQKKKGSDEKLTIEKARFEVHRFGLTGYEKQQQRVFEQDRAIMLGARPPKKQYVNYKDYQQMIKEKKMKEKEEAKSNTQKKRRKEGKTRPEKSKSSAGEMGGQVGHFKNGMLVLSSKDIQKLNVKVRK